MNKLRRTMLFCPASEPKMFINTPVYKPDCIIFDLEDAVALSEKDSARDLLCEAINSIDYQGIEIFVRVNPLYTPFGETDVREVVKAGVRNIRLPMCESKEDVKKLEELLEQIEKENNIELGSVKTQCAIETPKGVMNSYEIATSSLRVVAISFGAEDFTRELGVDRTKEATELSFARSQVVLSAKAASVDAIDTVWADIKDMEGFIKEAQNAKTIGFSGKSCIHPAQVKEVHRIFTPSKEEVEKSIQIIEAAKEAEEKGLGVIQVNGKMVDVPVIKKAERILSLAGLQKVL